MIRPTEIKLLVSSLAPVALLLLGIFVACIIMSCKNSEATTRDNGRQENRSATVNSKADDNMLEGGEIEQVSINGQAKRSREPQVEIAVSKNNEVEN